MKFSYDLLFGLPDEKIALFCLLGAQRMEGIYDKFCKKYLGGVNANSDALRELFELLEGGGKSRLELIYNRVYFAIPDTEDYDDELADQAQCAIISTSYCISYLVEKIERWHVLWLKKFLTQLMCWGKMLVCLLRLK